MDFKPDADDIRLHLQIIQNQFVDNENKKWWIKYAFHLAHIESAALILNDGFLRSRKNCNDNHIHIHNIASSEILAQTAQPISTYARLYFRPKTPMQFSIEGFRQPTQMTRYSQCGVPTVLLFNSDILTHKGCLFSDRNTSMSIHRHDGSAKFLKTLDFEKIFREGFIDSKLEKGERQAEILYPDSLSTDYLRWVICRTEAEQQTLLSLLTPKAKQDFSRKLRIEPQFFINEFFFIETVRYKKISNRYTFQVKYHFNEKTRDYIYNLEFAISDKNHQIIGTTTKPLKMTAPEASFADYTLFSPLSNFTLRITVKTLSDSCLCYQQTFIDNDLPF